MRRTQSLILIASISIILGVTGLTGCRWGNYSDPIPRTDPYSGYYETQAESLQMSVTLVGQNTVTVNAQPSFTPSLISSVFTNPVAFVVTDLTNMIAFITSPTPGNPALQVQLDTQSNISEAGEIPPETLWRDPACQTSVDMSANGKLEPGSGPFTSGSLLPLTGRIQLSLTYVQTTAGNCTQTWADIYQCYQNASLCGDTSPLVNQNLQQQWSQMLQPYINAKAMKTSDIPNVSNLSFTVQYM